jgi:hypothetical protein
MHGFLCRLAVLMLCSVSLLGQTAERTPETEAAKMRPPQAEYFATSPTEFPDTAVLIYADNPTRPLIRMKLGSAAGSAFKIFNSADIPLFSVQHDGPTLFTTNGTERMRINPNGGVTLNYPASHSSRLVVQHGTDGSSAIFATHQPTVEATVLQDDTGIFTQANEVVLSGAVNNGVLYGTRTLSTLDGGSGTLFHSVGSLIETGTRGAGTLTNMTGLRVNTLRHPSSTIVNGYGVYVGNVDATDDWAFFQTAPDDSNYFAGKVIVGGASNVTTSNALYVTGNAEIKGTLTGMNIKAHYQDVAEWVPSSADLEPGTVVILNPAKDNEVMASVSAYDTTVAGVVSGQPGLSLGIEGEGKEQVATTGRLRVRVDARRSPIRIGDLLVTSDVPGTAMRSEPMNISGRRLHQPGTIIGKALQSLDGGLGQILVLLSMQ